MPQNPADTLRTFTALGEEFVEVSMRHDPVAATLAGIHDYDDRYPDDTPDGFRERAAWLRDLDQRLVAAVPWEELPTEARVDYALLRSRLAVRRAEIEEIRVPQKNPALYPDAALTGIFLLLARPFAPLEERKESVLARLMALPEYLEAARANLQQVPPILRDIAAEVTSGGLAFVDDVLRVLLRSFAGEAERIEHAGERARLGLLRYQEFLDQGLRDRIGGSFAIGERWMNFRLEHEHLLAMDCAALEAFGHDHIARARAALEAEARRLDPGRTWRELIAAARSRHPEPLRVRDAYAAEMERARRFVADRGIAPIPEGRLEIVDTPPFERATIPLASYLAPAPFDVEPCGTFYVTPIDLGRRREEVDAMLESHNYSAITLAALHEAWPGHHLQLVHAARTGSRIRRLADNPVMAEGWALYCEEMMFEEGFFLDPLTRLYQLRDLLWRACRVVIDVGLQTGRMTTGQAVSFLIEHAMLEPLSAAIEVQRYALTPTVPLSFLTGRTLLLELREEMKRALGGRFSLGEFHEQVLRSGTIPPALVREELYERMGVPAPGA